MNCFRNLIPTLLLLLFFSTGYAHHEGKEHLDHTGSSDDDAHYKEMGLVGITIDQAKFEDLLFDEKPAHHVFYSRLDEDDQWLIYLRHHEEHWPMDKIADEILSKFQQQRNI